MFRDTRQRLLVCRTIIARGRMRPDDWFQVEPYPEMTALGADFVEGKVGYLSSGEHVIAAVAVDLWNGATKGSFGEIAGRLDSSHVGRLGRLLVAISEGEAAIDRWLAAEASR